MRQSIPIARPHIDRRDEQGVLKVLRSGVLALGSQSVAFEQGICTYTKSPYALSVANGTCGLHVAVRALGLQDGDEVITTPFSFISSSNALLFERAVPRFVDIEPTTLNLDPAKLEKAITKRTKAIMVVHIFGQTTDMTPVLKIAREHKLRVIEDACESLGATYKGRMAGTFGDIGVYAFYPNKQMTTGEGGMMVMKTKAHYELCKSLKNQGRNPAGDWLIHERLGYNYRLDEMSASLGVTQLKKLDWMIKKKAQLVRWYEQAFAALKDERVVLPQVGPHRTHSWFVYVVRITNGRRNGVMAQLAKQQIQTKPYLPVIHLQPFMREQFGYKVGDYPVAEQLASETLALPFFIGLTKADISRVAQEVVQAL